VSELFDLTPEGMIERFQLLRPDIYRTIPRSFFLDNYPWEETDMAERLAAKVK